MRKLFFISLLPLLFCIGCADIKNVECTGIQGFKIYKVNTDGIDAEVMITIRNPNDVGFSIYRSEFDIIYGGVKLGKARLAKRVHIGHNMEKAYPFLLNANFKTTSLSDVMKVLESISRKSLLEINGDLKVGKLFIKKKVPINHKEKISVD